MIVMPLGVKRGHEPKGPGVDLIDNTLKPLGTCSAAAVPKPLDDTEIVFPPFM